MSPTRQVARRYVPQLARCGLQGMVRPVDGPAHRPPPLTGDLLDLIELP